MAEESDKKLITPLIFNDEPIGRGETAYFQFEHYADTFARIIAARDTRTPLTIGVHGEWGSGKTTLMRRIQASWMRPRTGRQSRHPSSLWTSEARISRKRSALVRRSGSTPGSTGARRPGSGAR